MTDAKPRWWCGGCRGAQIPGCALVQGGCSWCVEGTGPCHHCRRRWPLRRRPIVQPGASSDWMTGAQAAVAPKREHLSTRIPELDRVLSGGWVRRQVVLFGGESGSGKTTLSMQAAHAFAEAYGERVLLASGEMPTEDLTAYAQQVGATSPRFSYRGIVDDVEEITAAAYEMKAGMLIVDSAQKVRLRGFGGDVGSAEAVRGAINHLQTFAKDSDYKPIVILISHVNGQGGYASGAGPQHDVDTLLWAEKIPIARREEKIVELSLRGKTRMGDDSLRAYLQMDRGGSGFRTIEDPRLAAQLAGL